MSKKQQVRKQKNIPPTIESLGEDHSNIIERLNDKSDRDAALTLTAYLDDTLNALYRKCLLDDGKPDGDFINSLLSGYGPLSTFRARIDMAYSLGWIGPNFRRSLNAFREIRNIFAHYYQIESFDHRDFDSEFETLAADVPAEWQGQPSRRVVFLIVGCLMSSHLALLSITLKRPKAGKDFEKGSHIRPGPDGPTLLRENT